MDEYWRRVNDLERTPESKTPSNPGEHRTSRRTGTPTPSPKSGAPSGYASERRARLTLTCLAASFTVLVIGLVVFFTVRTLRQSDERPTVDTPPVTTAEQVERAVGGLGPPPGTDVADYIRRRQQALATAAGDRLAIVSLSRYTTEARARSLAGSTEVLALLAAPPGGQPAVVLGDMAGWATAQTAEMRAERDEIQKLIPTVKDDPQFQSFYRSEVDRLNKAISAVKPAGDMVFGLVVRGPVPALQELARNAEVRLVDVSGGPEPLPKPDYRGLRPEETAKANTPNTRPA